MADAIKAEGLKTRPRRRWLRAALLAACGLLGLALTAALGMVLWLRSAARAALPALDGTEHLAGLSASVEVRRDQHGVPHIRAASQTDLWTAQGYVTAEDRLWQMDMLRRAAAGDLAQILGPSMARRDTEQRVLGFRRVAWRLYAALGPEDKARLDAYARGVNAYIARHGDALAPEFRLLGYRPEPWTGVDSLVIGMNMVEMLDSHYETKLSRERIAAKLNHDPKLLDALYPVGSWRDRPPTGELRPLTPPDPTPPPAAKTSDDDDEDDGDDRSQARLAPGVLDADPLGIKNAARAGFAPGSNNWVVAGSHTSSGRPLLANDMHLQLLEPNIWYMADLAAPGYHAAGVTLPGMPLVIEGHNEHVAWGYTALYADVQDLYIEKLDGKGNYEGTDGRWHALGHDRETIHVRGSKDIVVDVQSTGHGPLLNPTFRREQRPIALKWTLYDPALNALPLYEMNTAANWHEFHAAIARWCWPTQNLVYSDDQGHIAYHAIGKVPVRPHGAIFERPVGHAAQNLRDEWGDKLVGSDWQTYIPFDMMPNAFDPPSGFLATANARVNSDKFPTPLTHEWVEPYRVERIYQMLEGRDKLTPADMLTAQTDIYSEVDQQLADRFATAIERTPSADARLKQAAALMHGWDGRMTVDSPAASIVLCTRRALWPLLLKPKLGELAGEYQWAESNFAEEELAMKAPAEWLPIVYKNWDELLTEAVRQGLKEGHAPDDLARWSYGGWHQVEIAHPLAFLLPGLGRVLSTGPEPLSGDTTTVKQVGRSFGPSQRFTMDWSNVDGSTENIVLGESGNPLSPYYRDQWRDWYGGTSFPMAFSDAAVAQAARHTLRLAP